MVKVRGQGAAAEAKARPQAGARTYQAAAW
jgi:hypothetical protein